MADLKMSPIVVHPSFPALAAWIDAEVSAADLPCGYCMHCGYGGIRGEGSADCLHRKAASRIQWEAGR